MKEFKLNSMQLLHQTAPICASIMFIVIPFFDNVGLSYTLSNTKISIFQFPHTTAVIVSPIYYYYYYYVAS